MKKINSPIIILCSLSIFLTLLTTSCSGVRTDEDAVKKLIAKYVNAIIPAQRNGKFNDLVKVSAGKSLNKIDNSYNAFKNGEGIVLESMLVEMSFDAIEIGSGKDDVKVRVEYFEEEGEWREFYVAKETFVKTNETWKYKWINYKTLAPASEEVTANYLMEYTVDYVGGYLKVIDTEIIKEEILSSTETGVKWGDSPRRPMTVH